MARPLLPGAFPTDNPPAQKAFVAQLSLIFPLLSNSLNRQVSQGYGVYLPRYGIANRVTFVIDLAGRIDTTESGGDAIKRLKTLDA